MLIPVVVLASLLMPGKTPNQNSVEKDCVRHVFCIKRERVGSEVFFSAAVFSKIEVTVTFDFSRLVNVKSNAPLPFTKTFKKRGRYTNFLKLKQARTGFWDYSYSFTWKWGDPQAVPDPSYVYTLPYLPGEKYPVSQGFNGSFSHTGDARYAIDFAMPERTRIVAAREGQVIAIREEERKGGMDEDMIGKENYIRIRHSDGTIGAYYHLVYSGTIIGHGTWVAAGQVIGYSGKTGHAQNAHLHFEVYRPINGYRRQTLPIKFRAKEGEPLIVQKSRTYTAIAVDEKPSLK